MQDEPYDPAAWEPREARIARHAATLRDGLADLLAAPPFPEAEMLTAFRLKSGMAGHPLACSRAACRRANACRATDIEAGAACGERFDDATERDFQAMALGILIVARAVRPRRARGGDACPLVRFHGHGCAIVAQTARR